MLQAKVFPVLFELCWYHILPIEATVDISDPSDVPQTFPYNASLLYISHESYWLWPNLHYLQLFGSEQRDGYTATPKLQQLIFWQLQSRLQAHWQLSRTAQPQTFLPSPPHLQMTAQSALHRIQMPQLHSNCPLKCRHSKYCPFNCIFEMIAPFSAFFDWIGHNVA